MYVCIYIYIYIYIGSWAQLNGVINRSNRLCLYVFFPTVVRQRLNKYVPAAKVTRNNQRIAKGVCLCTTYAC
jgi:hypothetical protein